jgi:hypothetical protein
VLNASAFWRLGMQRALNVIYITESEYDVSFSLLVVSCAEAMNATTPLFLFMD